MIADEWLLNIAKKCLKLWVGRYIEDEKQLNSFARAVEDARNILSGLKKAMIIEITKECKKVDSKAVWREQYGIYRK